MLTGKNISLRKNLELGWKYKVSNWIKYVIAVSTISKINGFYEYHVC